MKSEQMKRLWILLLAMGLLASTAIPAAAITRGGVPDGDDHPYVGLMVAGVESEDGVFTPLWRCSGSLVSPTVFVTAGHCTYGTNKAQLWFESDLEPNRADYGYPFTGDASGTTHTHPDYIDELFYLYDLGVVVLDEPIHLDRYAELPEVDQLDTLAKGRNGAQITAVGYGLQGVVPDTIALLTRYQATLFVVNDRGFAGLRQAPGSGWFATSGDAKHGGTCFGDSGGPALTGDTIVGVTSFGLNPNCAGVGGAYRIDRETDLEFIESFR
jgi:hypothetical protein